MSLKRQLTLIDGVALALGSIMGSGLLFLPSLTAAVSEGNTAWVWILTTLLCFPLLWVFNDMVKNVSHGSGIEGFVSLGLGHATGAAIPIIFLGTVCIGMPISALIVGEYVRIFFSAGEIVKLATALLIIHTGVMVNFCGIKTGRFIQLCIAFVIFFAGICLFLMISPKISWHESFSFSSPSLSGIFPGVVLAFWAYSGFENLTFIANEFKNPGRDFKLSMIIALLLCGILYLLLALACLSVIPLGKMNEMAGLYQLAGAMENPFLPTLIVTFLAYFAVQINFNSWIWGISRLIYSSANQQKFPVFFSHLNKKQLPGRAILLLMLLFTIVVILLSYNQERFNYMITIVSTNFVFIYVLCLLSFISFKRGAARIFAMILLLLFIPLLFSSGWTLLYPLSLFLVGVFTFNFRNKGNATNQSLA